MSGPKTALDGIVTRLFRAVADAGRWRRRWLRRMPVMFGVDGPWWWRVLVYPSACLVPTTRRTEQRERSVGTPFVQHHRHNPLTGRAGRVGPNGYRQLSRDAADYERCELPMSDDAVISWLGRTERAQVKRRAAMLRTADDLVDELRGDRAEPGEVTVVCVTQRPELIDDIIANFTRQVYPHTRLLVIDNAGPAPESGLHLAVSQVDRAVSFHRHDSTSLGACLNIALEHCSTRYLAKFDDDDIYGSEYLSDLVELHSYADAAVVGKHSIFAEWRDGSSSRTLLRFVGREFRSTSHLAGGTLVIDMERIGDVRFPDVSIAEDQGFLRRCIRARLGVVAGDRFNYMQVRHDTNTWSVDLDWYLAGGVLLGDGVLTERVFV